MLRLRHVDGMPSRAAGGCGDARARVVMWDKLELVPI